MIDEGGGVVEKKLSLLGAEPAEGLFAQAPGSVQDRHEEGQVTLQVASPRQGRRHEACRGPADSAFHHIQQG